MPDEALKIVACRVFGDAGAESGAETVAGLLHPSRPRIPPTADGEIRTTEGTENTEFWIRKTPSAKRCTAALIAKPWAS